MPPTCGIGLPRKNAHEMNRWIETSRCLLECVQTLSRTIANGAAIIDESRPVQRPRRPRRRKRLESTYSHGDIQNTNGPCIQPLPTGYRVCTRFSTTQQTRERESERINENNHMAIWVARTKWRAAIKKSFLWDAPLSCYLNSPRQ